MRILHIIGSLDPSYGGPPMIAMRLAAAQAGLGHEVHLVTYEPEGGAQACEAWFANVPNASNVQVHAVRPGRVEAVTAHRARRQLRPLLDRVDVVHLHSIWESVLRIGAQEAYKRKVPYFVLLNGMLDPWSLAQSRWKKKLALALGYRKMLNRAAALHLGNSDEQNLIAPLRLRAPFVIIPNGVFLEEIASPPPKGTFFSAHPELGDQPYVLFMSRLHYKKGLDVLAEAFPLLAEANRDVRLVVAGPDGGARADFERRINETGFGSRVHLVGPVYGEQKIAALVDAACFVLPSRQEGFSVAITEAIGFGVPAVITEGCHFPEVGEAGAGEVVPLNHERLAAALIRVMADAELRQRMGENGRRLVAERYTWPRIAEMTLSAYRAAKAGVHDA